MKKLCFIVSKMTAGSFAELARNSDWPKIVSIIRKYHNHKQQTNPSHREEEPHNNHESPGRHTMQSNHLSLPHQDDCKTRMVIK